MSRFLFSCIALLALGACKSIEATGDAMVGPGLASFVVLDAVSVINTQKTVDDHLVSWVTGQDCSTIRASKGDHYCVDKPQVVPLLQRVTYCYKSLATMSCYDRPLDFDAARLYGTRLDQIPITAR